MASRSNPLISIGASTAGSFFVIGVLVYCNAPLLGGFVKLKDFDTVMGVGVGVNLALGVLKGIRDSICGHYRLRFNGVKSDISDRLKNLVSSGKLKEEDAKHIEAQSDELQLSIENNKAHDRTQTITVSLSVGTAMLYCAGLTVTAFKPESLVYAWFGVPIVLFVLAPIAIYILCISFLAAYPEYKSIQKLKTIDGFSQLTGPSEVINPVSPKI